MEIAIELLLALALASCTGLRAWLPLLAVSLLARHGYMELHPSFAFLARTDALVVFGAATAIEILGDKVVAVDHALDAVGAVVRPAAGAVLASSMFLKLDPLAAVALGLIVGGGAAFTVNAGKALARTQATALAPAHGGLGNAALSTLEDLVTAAGVALAVVAPWLAALVALSLLAASFYLIRAFLRTGGHLLNWLRRRAAPP